MRSRRKAREAALQALYQCDTLSMWESSAVELYFSRFQQEVSLAAPGQIRKSLQDNFLFCKSLIASFLVNDAVVDELIGQASDRWSVRRMARVDRNILRIAVIELFGFDDIPAKVSINEAIELAKRFGTNESPVFVNGVLDHLASNPQSLAFHSVPAGFWEGREVPADQEPEVVNG